MPNEFWRYTSYDAARKRKEQEQAQKPVTPLLPPLTITTPKPKNTLPSWLGASQQTGDTPDWVNAPQAQSTPSWVSPQPALGGETAPLQPEAEPRNPAEPRNFRWWEQPTQQEVQAWEEYNPTPAYQPGSFGQALKDTGQAAGALWRNAFKGGQEAVPENPVGYGVKVAGTYLDALTGSIFGTIDKWTQSGQLTTDEAQQFKLIYDSIDPAIHPNIRAMMAREALPRSTKQKILEIVDWTTQNMAKQASGEWWAAMKGGITGADVEMKDAEGNVIGTKRSSIPNYLLNATLRSLAGGGFLAAYGQGIDADIIRRAVTGENGGLINPELYQDIMRNREEWKQVENAAPRAYQFVSEMVTDPINVVSTAMGTSAGLMKKRAVAEGAKVSEMALARATQQGLVTADNLADMQKIAGVVGKAAESASMAKQFTPEFKALLGFSQAIDTAQNKGYLVSLPGDAAIGMYFAQKTYMRYGPKLLGAFAKKLTNLIAQPKVPNMPEVYKTLGDIHYQQAIKDAAEAGVKIPDKTYYLERETNTLQSMPTREYYTKTVQDAMTAPLNIDAGNGKVYPTLGDMVVDYVKRKDYRPEDFLDLTQVDLGANKAQVEEYVKSLMVEPDEFTPQPQVLGRPPERMSIPEQLNAARPWSVWGYRESPTPKEPLRTRTNFEEAQQPAPVAKPAGMPGAGIEGQMAKVPASYYDRYQRIKQGQPDTLILMRIGDFYEALGEDAKKFSDATGSIITMLNIGDKQKIPMAGVPYNAKDSYVAQLISKGIKVGVVDNPMGETPSSKVARGSEPAQQLFTTTPRLPSTNEYAVTLRQKADSLKLDENQIEELISNYNRGDAEEKRFLADEIGAKAGAGNATVFVPPGWKQIDSSAPPEKFAEYAEGSGLVDEKGLYWINPENESWVRERLFSGGYNLEPAGTRAKLGLSHPFSPLDELIQSELRKQAQQGGGMDLDYEQARQAAERAVVDDITSNWKDLDEAQRWLDSNDETMEVHLRDDTPVSREAVQEAINRKRGVTPETVVPSAQDVMDSIERAGVFASAYEPDARYMASMEYDGQMAIRKATSLDSVIRAGDEIITLYNPITGTEVGTIDLVNGRATAIRPENQARVENAFEALKKAARDKKINYEIANLRNSPVKNAERIAALEKLKQISLSKSTITTPVAQEVTDVGVDVGNKKQGAQGAEVVASPSGKDYWTFDELVNREFERLRADKANAGKTDDALLEKARRNLAMVVANADRPNGIRASEWEPSTRVALDDSGGFDFRKNTLEGIRVNRDTVLNAEEWVRKFDAADNPTPTAPFEDIPFELRTPDQFLANVRFRKNSWNKKEQNFALRVYDAALKNALSNRKPVSASGVDARNVTLPEGYELSGDQYVYKQPSTPKVTPPAEQVVQSGGVDTGKVTGIDTPDTFKPVEAATPRVEGEKAEDVANVDYGKPGGRHADATIPEVDTYQKKGGWKLNLTVATENYAKVDEWLDKNWRGQYKLLDGGEPQQNDFTIYVGSRDDADILASSIKSELDDALLPNASGSTYRKFNDKVAGRFDIRQATEGTRGTQLYSYGKNGVPFDADAGNSAQTWGAPKPPTYDMDVQRHIDRINKLLIDKYGEYYTGSKQDTTETQSATPAETIAAATSRSLGKPVDVFRTAAGTGEESGKTLHIPSHFALGELDDVQPSHMLDTFTPNPKYPQERQGRDYNSVAAKGTVTEGINNPNYRAMVWPAEEVDTGMPLVTSDGAVVNGTNRRLILEGWSRDPQKWAEYQDALAKALPELGLNAADLSKYKKPILYRVVDEGVPESDIMKASRVFQTTKGLNQLEAAKINADVLTKRMLAGLEIGKTPRETFDNPRNQSFIQDYINNQPSTHRGELMNKEGKLTDKAVDEIRDAIFIAVYGKRGEKLLDKFTSSGEAKMVGDALFNSISDLARAEERIKMGMADKELSLVDDIIGSVDHLLQMRRQGMTLDEYVNTKTLFDIGLPEMNKAQKQLLGIWDSIVKGNRVSMREVLKRYASLVSEPLQYDLEGKVVPQTAGQLFSRALGEVGIENVDLDFGPRVQEVFDTGTPANAPSVNYDKPVFDTHKNQDGTYQAEWNKVVNKDGKADVKDTPLISVSNRDWHSYDDKTKRAVIEQMINNSAFASAPNKAEIIDDIIKTTNDWADKYLEVEVKAATGGVPDEVFTGGGKPEQPAQPPQLPAASEGTQPPPQQPVPQQPAGSTGTQPAPQQPAVPGGTGGQGGKPPTQPPAAGAGVQPAPQQPSGGKPSTTLFPLGTAQQGKAQAKAPRAKTQANQQAQMPTAPGKVPPAAQGSSTLFNPQAKSAEIVGEIQARAPWWAKRAAKKGKNIRTLVKLTRGFVPETGAFEKDSLAGAVEGYTLQQAGGIVATAEHYLTDSFSAWKDAGITITANKNGTNQMVDAFRLKPIDQQPAKLRSGADVPDEVRHMSNNLNDILSFPDFFESTAVDPLIKAQQEKALIDTVSLGERMIIELSNEAKSRGIPWDRSRVIADYYFPRAVDNIDDIEPLKYSNDKKFREHITATEGMNRANEPIEYGNVQEAFTTYLRRIADRISAHETFMTLRSLGGKTTEELIDLNTKTNLAVQQGFLDNVGKAEETIKQLALNGDANYGTSPMTMHPEISWVNSVLDPADEFALRVYEMAHETDPATRTLLAKALLGDTNNVGKIYRKAVSDAQKLVEIERNRIINLGRSTRGAMGLPGNANEPVAIASIEKFMGEETLHMPREDAKYVNEWFDSRVSKSNVIARLNDANALSRAVTMSSDLEMVRRLAATFYLHPDVYIKSLIAAFSDEEQMAKWMTSNDVAPYVKLAQKYGINLDASSEAQDAFLDIRNGAVYNWMTKKKTYQRLAAFSANPANVAQVLMFKADWNHIQELGIKRAQRLHDTTPEGIERATDYEARGYFRALQDHIGVRSLLGSGTTKLFRTTTRTIFMSGRKTVGTVNAQMNWFKKGAQGETARKLLVGDAMALTASAIALYATHLIVNGKDPEEADHWKEFVDPTSPNFLKVEIGGTRIGPGGTVMTLLDYYFQLGDAVASGDTSRIAKQLPNWWLGRLSPVGNIARTKITGKNYQGVKVEGEDWFSELAPAIIPTTFQDVVLPDVYRHNPAAQKVVGGLGAVWAGKVAGAFAQWIGDRSVSETPSMLLTKARNAASLEAYGKKWDELDQVDKWQLTEAVPDLKLLDKAALERSSEKDNPSAMFELAKMSRYEDIAAKADVYRRQFEVGQRADGTPYSGADYRADLSELDKERAQVEIDLKAGNPVFKDIPVTSAEKKAYYAKYGISEKPVDKFINAWYQCTQDAIVDETTEQIDFEKLFAARDALTARTSPTVLAKAMPYINRNKNAMIIRAQAVYNTYMNLPKYDGLSKEQAKQVDEFKQEWETLRLASVPNPKQVAAQKFPAGYRMYEARGKQASKARRRFMYRNGKDSSNGYTTNGTLINLFYADLTMADLLEYQPEMASIL